MAKVYRLSHADFAKIRPLRSAQGRFLVLTVGKSLDSKARFACVVSKKTAQRANKRNLIKRRCRAAVQKLTLPAGLTYVFTAKRAATECSYTEMSDDMQALITKALAGIKPAAGIQ